ncbi:MAG: hypothetical protein HYV14_13575 [Elusimicrobia bacterium]|nr:hypothetical protein [Elusimicrobiota bacterium]
MRRRQHRHPALEAAVFAAALLLAAFVGRELWLRRAAAPSPEAPSAAAEPAALNPDKPPLPSMTSPGRTETAVTAVPSIKLSRVQRRKPKPAAVPAPR